MKLHCIIVMCLAAVPASAGLGSTSGMFSYEVSAPDAGPNARETVVDPINLAANVRVGDPEGTLPFALLDSVGAVTTTAVALNASMVVDNPGSDATSATAASLELELFFDLTDASVVQITDEIAFREERFGMLLEGTAQIDRLIALSRVDDGELMASDSFRDPQGTFAGTSSFLEVVMLTPGTYRLSYSASVLIGAGTDSFGSLESLFAFSVVPSPSAVLVPVVGLIIGGRRRRSLW